MKKQNMNRAGNMDIDAWREREISKRVKLRIDEDNQEFARKHGEDTDEALRGYVRRKAEELGRMPHPLELHGGIYLSRRLGDWRKLAESLGLAPAASVRGKRVYLRLKSKEAERFAEERRAIKKEKKRKYRQREQAIAENKKAYLNTH